MQLSRNSGLFTTIYLNNFELQSHLVKLYYSITIMFFLKCEKFCQIANILTTNSSKLFDCQSIIFAPQFLMQQLQESFLLLTRTNTKQLVVMKEQLKLFSVTSCLTLCLLSYGLFNIVVINSHQTINHYKKHYELF